MRHDVAARTSPAIGMKHMAHTRRQQPPPLAVDSLGQRLAVAGEQQQQRCQVRAVPGAVDIGFGQADVAARQHVVEHLPAGDFDMRIRSGLGVAETEMGAVRQAQVEPAVVDFRQQLEHGSGAARRRPGVRRHGERVV